VKESSKDPRVVAALEAQIRLGEAMHRLDIPAVELLTAADMVVHAPINTVVDRDNMLARLRSGKIGYEHAERKIDFAEPRGDWVVIMGEEIVRPVGDAPHAGKTIRRRFTDIWKDTDGSWKLAVRQATIISVE
jgi:hypothetical protein